MTCIFLKHSLLLLERDLLDKCRYFQGMARFCDPLRKETCDNSEIEYPCNTDYFPDMSKKNK